MTFDANVGKTHPTAMSSLHRCGCDLVVPERGRDRRPDVGSSFCNEDPELLEDLAEDLEYLTIDIDAPHIDDLPRWMWRHVAGVGSRLDAFLGRWLES